MKNHKLSHPSAILQVAAWALVAVIGTSLTLSGPTSNTKASSQVGLDVRLEDNGSATIIRESASQLIDTYTLTNISEEDISISGLSFYPEGGAQKKIRKFNGLVPLTIKLEDEVIAKGTNWVFDFEGVHQTVTLDEEITLKPGELVSLGLYANLLGQSNTTFGASLLQVFTADHGVLDLPLSGKIYIIRPRI